MIIHQVMFPSVREHNATAMLYWLHVLVTETVPTLEMQLQPVIPPVFQCIQAA